MRASRERWGSEKERQTDREMCMLDESNRTEETKYANLKSKFEIIFDCNSDFTYRIRIRYYIHEYLKKECA